MLYSKVRDENNETLSKKIIETEQMLINIEAALSSNIEFVDNTLLIQISTVILSLIHRIRI